MAEARRSPPRDDRLRERLYLGLLLLVGVGAIGTGLLQAVDSGGRSIAGMFDLALGACVLLVAWLFLAPSALPAYCQDPTPERPRVERPYLAAARARSGAAAVPSSGPPRPAPTPPAIPRWADPMLHLRTPPPVHASGLTASPHGPSHGAPHRAREAPVPAAAPAPPPVRRPKPESAPMDEASLFAGLPLGVDEEEERPPRPVSPDEGFDRDDGTPSADILQELDRIEAELRHLVPSERAPRGTPALAHVEARTG